MAKRNLPNGEATPMESGERDRAVTVQQLTVSVGTSGFPVETWSELFATVWMRRMDMGQSEKFRASQLSSPADVQWEMGYCEEMDPELVDVPQSRRLLYQGRTYDIVSASQIGRREGIELLTLSKGKVA